MQAKTSIFLLFGFLFSSFAKGQQSLFDIQNLPVNDRLSFPVIKSLTKDTSASRTINQYLQLSVLGFLGGYGKESPFDAINYACKTYANNSQIISLRINETLCSEDCSTSSLYFTFNSANGDRIQLQDIFTSKGFRVIQDKVITKSYAHLNKEAMRLIPSDSTIKRKLSECFENFDFSAYYTNGTSIFIDGKNCFNKTLQELKPNMITEFSFSDFKDYLSDYGKAVFGISNVPVSQFRSTSISQLYEGTLADTLPIIFVLQTDPEIGERGCYINVQNGDGACLSGLMSGRQSLFLSSMGDDGEVREYVEAQLIGKQIIGTTKNKDKTKVRKFAVKRR